MCEHKRAYTHKVYPKFLQGHRVSLHGDRVAYVVNICNFKFVLQTVCHRPASTGVSLITGL